MFNAHQFMHAWSDAPSAANKRNLCKPTRFEQAKYFRYLHEKPGR